MPLHANLKRRVVALDCFDDSVTGLCTNAEAFSGASDALMVQAIHIDFALLHDFAETCLRLDLDGMDAISFGQLVILTPREIFGEVVVEASPLVQGHELGSITDPQNGDFATLRRIKDGLIKFELFFGDWIKRDTLLIAVGFEWLEVVSAGENQAFDFVDLVPGVGIHGKESRVTACLDHSLRIGLVNVEVFPPGPPLIAIIQTEGHSDSRAHGETIGVMKRMFWHVLWVWHEY